MSVLERCPPYREKTKGSKERQEPTLGIRLTEVSVKRESTVNLFHLFSTFFSLISRWTVLNLNLLHGLQSILSSRTPMSLSERPVNIFMLEQPTRLSAFQQFVRISQDRNYRTTALLIVNL